MSDLNEPPLSISTTLCLIEITSWRTLIDFEQFEEQNWATGRKGLVVEFSSEVAK